MTMSLKLPVIIQVLWISSFELSGWNDGIFGLDLMGLEKFTVLLILF